MSGLNEQVKLEIDNAFACQQSYALELRKSDYKRRIAVLDRFEQVFRASEEKIYKSAADDFGKPQAETDMAEIMPVLMELKHVRKNLKKWMKPVSVRATMMLFGTSSKIVKEPKGVTLIVSPWNYPFYLTFGPMISSIAAGNTVIIQHCYDHQVATVSNNTCPSVEIAHVYHFQLIVDRLRKILLYF